MLAALLLPLAVAVVPAVLTAAALAVPLLERPQRGLLVLAALVPFQGLLLIAGLPAVVSWWKEGLVLALFAASFVAPAPARSQHDRRWPAWFPAIAGLGLLAVAWVPFSGAWEAFWGLKIGFFYVLVALTAWRCPFDARERDHLVSLLMGVTVVTAGFGLVQQVLGGDRLAAMGWEWDATIRTAGGFLRSFSTFNQPFPFAFTLTVALLVALPVAAADRRRARNRWFLWATPLVLAGLAASIVRTAWLALLVGLVYLALERDRWLVPWLGAVVAGAVVAVLLAPGPVLGAATSASSFEDRTSAWSENLSELAGAPFGLGLGTTGSAGQAATVAAADPDFTDEQITVDGNAFQPDSQFYKVLLEFGPLGLWLFVLLLLSAFATARRAATVGPTRDRPLAAGMAAAVLAVAVSSTAATALEIFPLDVLFWLLLGVIASLDRRSD